MVIVCKTRNSDGLTASELLKRKAALTRLSTTSNSVDYEYVCLIRKEGPVSTRKLTQDEMLAVTSIK